MINTAVILAARKERSSKTPYPLLQFYENTNLIDRTLSILNEIGVENIYLVVGYRKELFLDYQKKGISLIYNDKYAYTSSMASLACAEKLIHNDFLLIEGDTFYEKKVVEQLSKIDKGNCFVITEESGNGDEAFVELQEGFITKLSKDKHQMTRFDGELLGVCRITADTYKKMIDCWKQCSNPYLNYEYAFMDVTLPLQRPCLQLKNLIWGDVDTDNDFHRLREYTYPMLRRKENPFDYENIVSYVQNIFSKQDVAKYIKIEQIGGMSNKNFKVLLNNHSYVLRIPGLASEEMVNRRFEEQNSILASQIGINPTIKYFNLHTGIKLADYIKGAETLNSGTIQRADNIKKIANIYHTLHYSKVRFYNDFNVFAEIIKYEQILKRLNIHMYDGYDNIRDKIFELEYMLNDIGVQLMPCHNDAVPENFIKDIEGKLYLIDWEYSGMNDPVWDFAALFLEANFTPENQDMFLYFYYGDKLPLRIKEKIHIYTILMDILWAMWTVAKEAKGDNFGTYGIDRFHRAIKNINKKGLL
nr:phosphotransferase [uncultured Prevotella sp.]